MRTVGQGQAAVPRRGCTAEGWLLCLERRTWAAGEYPADCHEQVERYPKVPGVRLGTSGFAMGAGRACGFFVCAGGCGPGERIMWREKK